MGRTPIVILDAGHGLNTPGKRIPNAGYVPEEYRGIREWTLNNRVADLVENFLRGYDVSVMRADDRTGATDRSLSSRKRLAEQVNADAFISIHHNAGINGRSGGGIVVYSRKQTASEARKFFMGEMAHSLYECVVACNNNAGNRAQHCAQSNFTVLYGNKARIALLLENGFMDAPQDIPLIVSYDYAVKTASGIASFLCSQLSLHYVGEETPVPQIPTASCRGEYTVKKGDSLWSIAAKFYGRGNDYKKIVAANGLMSNTILPGQKLRIPD